MQIAFAPMLDQLQLFVKGKHIWSYASQYHDQKVAKENDYKMSDFLILLPLLIT